MKWNKTNNIKKYLLKVICNNEKRINNKFTKHSFYKNHMKDNLKAQFVKVQLQLCISTIETNKIF